VAGWLVGAAGPRAWVDRVVVEAVPGCCFVLQWGDRISYTNRITVCFTGLGACLILLLVLSRVNSWALLGR
jgi:hypothetical protein